MTAKEFLSQPYNLNRTLSFKTKLLESLREHSPCAGINYSGMPKAPSIDRSQVEKTALRIVSLETEIKEQRSKLQASIKQVSEAISRVGDIESETLLEMRYLSYLDWGEISATLGYSSSTLFRKHREALALVKVPQV